MKTILELPSIMYIHFIHIYIYILIICMYIDVKGLQ